MNRRYYDSLFNVGHALCFCALGADDGAVLVDTGEDENTAQKVLKTFEENDIEKYKAFFTHGHKDHCKGFNPLVEFCTEKNIECETAYCDDRFTGYNYLTSFLERTMYRLSQNEKFNEDNNITEENINIYATKDANKFLSRTVRIPRLKFSRG